MLLLTTDASVDARRFLPPGSVWAGYWDDPPRRFPERLSDEAARIVEKAIGELAPRPQVVIVLRDVQGWSAEQVCAALAIGTPSTGDSCITRARRCAGLSSCSTTERDHQMSEMSALTCQDVVELATDLLEQQLGRLEAEVIAHLDGCPGCRAYIEQMRQTIRALASLKREPLSTEEFTALLNAFRSPPPA